LLPIARSLEVEIYAPSSKWMASFASSPRLIHAMARAIDISTGAEFGDEALSPIEGRVELVKEIEVGPGPFSSIDYVIVIRCGKRFVKITHVAPSVLPGDYVRVGDPLGRYLKTNDVRPYSPPHMHLEVFSSRSSWRLNLIKKIVPTRELIEFLKQSRVHASSAPSVKARVVHASDSYTLLEPADGGACISVVASRKEAVLDGELRHRTVYVGLVSIDRKKLRPVGAVVFLGAKVAQVKKLFGDLAIGLNFLGPYMYTLNELAEGDPWRVVGEGDWAPLLNALDIRVSGRRVQAIRIFIGTLACMLVPERVEDSHVYISVRNTSFSEEGFERLKTWVIGGEDLEL